MGYDALRWTQLFRVADRHQRVVTFRVRGDGIGACFEERSVGRHVAIPEGKVERAASRSHHLTSALHGSKSTDVDAGAVLEQHSDHGDVPHPGSTNNRREFQEGDLSTLAPAAMSAATPVVCPSFTAASTCRSKSSCLCCRSRRCSAIFSVKKN